MAYAMYLRKSRRDVEAEQRGEGETLARHRRILNDLASSMRLPIDTVYQEVVTGDTIAGRPQMQRLLSDIESGVFEGVFVMEVERLARGDTIDQGIVAQTFKYTGTKIITPLKTYDPQNAYDEEYFEFSLFMSRREYSTIKRRMNAGKLAAANEGRFVSNVPPYGYDRTKCEDGKGFTLAPNTEAEIVQQIFTWYTGYPRMGTTNIAHKLNDLGVPTRSGKLWTTATIQGIIHNPVYIGKIRWNSRARVQKMEEGLRITTRPRNGKCLVVDGLHTPIITMPVWEQAQENINNNRPAPVNRGKETQNALAGLVICGRCGRKMVRRGYQQRQQPSLMCPIAECTNVSSDLDIVEKKVIASIEAVLNSMIAAAQKPAKPPVMEMNALNALTGELKTLEGQQDQIRNLLERGVYDVPTYQERNQKVADSISEAKKKLRAAENAVTVYETANKRAEIVIPKLRDILDVYWDSTPAMRNDMLKTVVDRIVYTREESTRWKERNAFTVELFLREKITA